MTRSVRIFLTTFLCAAVAIAAAPPPELYDLARPAVRVFNDRDGLPQNSVMKMTFDRRGDLWIGTQEGLAVYNGREWDAVALPEGAKSKWVRALMSASDGAVWVGTSGGGVARLVDGQWTTWGVNEGLPDEQVRCVYESRASGRPVIWAGTKTGLARFDGVRWHTVFRNDAPSTNAYVWSMLDGIHNGRDGMWVATGIGIYRVEGGRPVNTTAGSLVGVLALQNSGGHLFAGTTKGLYRLGADGSWVAVAGVPEVRIFSLASTTNRSGSTTLWAGTYAAGVIRIDRDRVRVLDKAFGVPAENIYALLPEGAPAQRMWIGCDGSGVIRVDLRGWRALDDSNGLPSSSVYSFLERAAGTGEREFWVGTDGGGVALWQNGSWRIFDKKSGALSEDVVLSILETQEGSRRRLWFGTAGGGLAMLEGGKWKQYAPENGFPSQTVRQMIAEPSPDGTVLWMATRGGLVRMQNDVTSVIGKPQGLPVDGVLSMARTVDATGQRNLWLGTEGGGLVRWNEKSMTVIDSSKGLANDSLLSVTATTERGRQYLWAGTQGGGAARIDLGSGVMTTFSTRSAPPLPNDTVYRVTQDTAGRLYFFTNRGVARFTPTEGAPGYTADTFTPDDGLPSSEFNQGASYVDSDGRIWGGTIKGVAVFDSANEVSSATTEALRIDRISVAGQEWPPTKGARLRYPQRSISFDLALPALFREKETRFRTQLVGLDPSPSSWTRDFKKEYPSLPPGRYTFRVWARDYTGHESGPVSYSFTVLPAPWETWWAYILYALVIAAAVYAIARVRIVRLRRRNEELREAVAQRTTELTETNRRLEEAQERIGRLMQSSSSALQDIDAWATNVASDLVHMIGAREIGVWEIDGLDVRPLNSASIAVPEVEELQRLLRRGGQKAEADRATAAVAGLTGELCGAIVVSGKRAWSEAETRVLASFAHQLGGALELQRMRRGLAVAEERRAASRQQMLARGIDLVRVCPVCHRCFDQNHERCVAEGATLGDTLLFPFRVGGRYELSRVLGSGGMGTVYEARDLRLGRDVALKVIRPEHFDNVEVKLRFAQEARILARIDHPGVIAIHDSGEIEDGSAYIVTERLRGVSLRDVLVRFGPGKPRQVARLLRQGSAALAAAHGASVVHRDIKPDNVFLVSGSDGFEVRLLDFGLSKSLDGDTRLTQTGIIVGTPAYMSPEQVMGKAVDARTDVYSFAVVAWEALVGKSAFENREVATVLVHVLGRGVPALSSIFPSVPRVVDDAFASAVAKDADSRVKDVEAWVASFVDVLEMFDTNVAGWPDSFGELAAAAVPAEMANSPTLHA